MANKYVSAAGGNWATSGTWVTADGGSTVTTTPTTSDVCYVTSNSGALTLDNTTNTCRSIYFTGYTNTLSTTSASNILTIVTDLTLGSGMSFGATGARIKMTTGAGTYTSNGVTLPWDWEFSSATGTKTLADNWTVTGCVYMSANATINGNNLYISGGWKSTSASQRTLYGTVAVTLTGGEWVSTVKRTAGSVTLAGNVTISGGNSGSGSGGIYDSSLTYSSGTITAVGAFFVGGSSSLTLGSSCHLDDLDGSGTLTLGDDLYLDGTVQVAGTASLTVNGSGGNRVIYFAEHLVMYNLGTFVNADGTARMVATGTGTIFRGISLNGMTYNPASALQIPLEINTAGTITFGSSGYACRFGGLGSLTYTAGTVNFYSGSYIEAYSGTTSYDIDPGFTVPQMTVTSVANITSPATITILEVANGATANGVDGVALGALRLNGSGTYSAPNATTTTVSTYLELNGTGTLQPVIAASPIVLTPFKGGLATTMNNAGPTPSMSVYKRKTHTATGALSDYTFAFDFVYDSTATNYSLIQGGGYLWIPSGYEPYFYLNLSGSNGYRFYHGLLANGVKHRIVLYKQYGVSPKMYIDGVLKNPMQLGSSTVNTTINPTTFARPIEGDYLIFDSIVSTDWIAADYAAFVANGNSSAGVYTDAESGLTHGWHVDSWTYAVTNMSLVYNGTSDNQKVFRGDLRFVNVTGIPVKSYIGTVTDCDNAYAPDWDNIKTMAYASAG